MLVSSYHFLEGPLIAVGALAVIVLMMRWVFSTDHRPPRFPQHQGAVETGVDRPEGAPAQVGPRDFGLLEPVCTATTPQQAAVLQERLKQSGIRCTVAAGPDDLALLVFRADAARARALVSR